MAAPCGLQILLRCDWPLQECDLFCSVDGGNTWEYASEFDAPLRVTPVAVSPPHSDSDSASAVEGTTTTTAAAGAAESATGVNCSSDRASVVHASASAVEGTTTTTAGAAESATGVNCSSVEGTTTTGAEGVTGVGEDADGCCRSDAAVGGSEVDSVGERWVQWEWIRTPHAQRVWVVPVQRGRDGVNTDRHLPYGGRQGGSRHGSCGIVAEYCHCDWLMFQWSVYECTLITRIFPHVVAVFVVAFPHVIVVGVCCYFLMLLVAFGFHFCGCCCGLVLPFSSAEP